MRVAPLIERRTLAVGEQSEGASVLKVPPIFRKIRHHNEHSYFLIVTLATAYGL